MAQKSWGTQVALRLSGLRGPLTCQLIAINEEGTRQTVSTWTVPSAGYATDTQSNPLTIQGGAGFLPGDIIRFDVLTTTGNILVSVNVSSRSSVPGPAQRWGG
jgi:hypothetical protein